MLVLRINHASPSAGHRTLIFIFLNPAFGYDECVFNPALKEKRMSTPTTVWQWLGALALWASLLPAFAQETKAAAVETVTRHQQEMRGLTDPAGVLRDLPPLIAAARAAGDSRELALLYLAESNACRVNANWPCQSEAAARARQAAEAAKLPALQIRGLILESRGRLALQDFSRASQLLGEAERLLQRYPNPEATADVYLAYSSLSYSVGKHAKAAEYAERGLSALGDTPALVVRIRLLRNKGRAMAQLGNAAEAHTVLQQALTLVEQVKDPKLSAELRLEDARIARLTGDIAKQQENGRIILSLAAQLSNSQLFGLGHEVMGLAALNQSDNATAERELRLAQTSFRELKLERDERRVLRALIRSMLGRGVPRADLEGLTARSLSLEASLEADDRNMAADDFEARLKYAQQELDVQRLEAAADMAKQREAALAEQQRLTQIAAALAIVLLLVFGMLFLAQRHFNQRLKAALQQLSESEARYRTLAENSRDVVVRMRPDGQRLYVSPATREMLGMEPEEFLQPRWDLIHPDDREMMRQALRDLILKGGTSSASYRARHKNGEYVWIEILSRLVPPATPGASAEIVYSGRDITARVRAEQALLKSEAQLRAVTDNIPAMIARVDKEQRYTFVNAFVGEIFGGNPQAMVGRTMREVRGEALYATMRPHVEAALRGEVVNFEGTTEVDGRTYHYQSNYVPDRDANDEVQGMYALTFDITELKLAEAKLERLARVDSLSGVANRRFFEEQFATAFARSRRHGTALALLCLDIDHFKTINDKHGHPVGDAVIIAFARRLESCVREDDLVARLGGDEFVLLIENPAADSAENIAQKLLAAMREPIMVDGITLQVSASIGVATVAQPESIKALMDLADRALYAAKEAGRNTWRSANPSPPGRLR